MRHRPYSRIAESDTRDVRGSAYIEFNGADIELDDTGDIVSVKGANCDGFIEFDTPFGFVSCPIERETLEDAAASELFGFTPAAGTYNVTALVRCDFEASISCDSIGYDNYSDAPDYETYFNSDPVLVKTMIEGTPVVRRVSSESWRRGRVGIRNRRLLGRIR